MIKVYVLTISDRSYRKERDDLTGPTLIRVLSEYRFNLSGYEILPDDEEMIKAKLMEIADSGEADLILTAGGTGFAARDVTPEATSAIAERMVPGIAEAIREEGMKKTKHAMLSRAVSVIRKRTLIINLPGSPRGADESLRAVADTIGHGIALLKGETPDG